MDKQNSMSVFLADGQEKIIPENTTGMELAKLISHSLARKCVAITVNGDLKDLQDQVPKGAKVSLVTKDDAKSAEVINHSCEHILATAVLKLFPKAQVTMGPQDHSEGFYYDFDIGRPFTDKDLALIEEKMHQIIKSSITFEKRYVTKEEAHKLFDELGQTYKREIIDWIKEDRLSIYQSDNFIDLCRGPHLPSSKFIKAFKLLNVSGCYWRADAANTMLQRINGIAFGAPELLDEYLFKIEEAKKRDHRKLGQKHELFCVSERFGSWQDEKNQKNEARVLIHIPKEAPVSLATVTQQMEGLFEKIKATLPSKELFLTSMNTVLSEKDETPLMDFRLFLKKNDASKSGEIFQLAAQFSQDSGKQITAKVAIDTQAHEDIGPGLVMWLPNGGKLRTIIEDFSRQKHYEGGYEMVYSPHIAKSDLWRISGHLGFYSDSMFAPMNVDGNEYLLKPMNCPFHVLMYKHKPRSYKELPLRLAEFGTVYRYELAGVLHGLMRVRGFTQDDAHIFCTWEQLDQELAQVLQFIRSMLESFGFKAFEVNISTRPEKYVGAVEDWNQAEASLKKAADASGFHHSIDEGGGAFYGPKIDIKLKDCLDRSWQCSTVQLDFNNPERFDLTYINNKGEKKRPVMLHRALLGSIERFIGVLIEHYAGAFPAWMAPEQVRILTVSDRHHEHAQSLHELLTAQKIRTKYKQDGEKLGAKIRQAQMDKVPIMLIVGDEEVSKKGATIRLRNQEDKGFYENDKLVSFILEQTKIP